MSTPELQKFARPDHSYEHCYPTIPDSCYNLPAANWTYNKKSYPHRSTAVLPISSLHLVGGAVYGTTTSANFLLKGIDNVYIVDSSLFREFPDVNPQGTISVMGAYVAKYHVQARAAGFDENSFCP